MVLNVYTRLILLLSDVNITVALMLLRDESGAGQPGRRAFSGSNWQRRKVSYFKE
jgi:hypothetical protein